MTIQGSHYICHVKISSLYHCINEIKQEIPTHPLVTYHVFAYHVIFDVEDQKRVEEINNMQNFA